MSTEERARLAANIAGPLHEMPREVQLRQIAHFAKAEPKYGASVAGALGIAGFDVKLMRGS